MGFDYMDYVVMCFGLAIFAVIICFVGKLIWHWSSALMDRYRAKTDLIRAQAEQTRKDALK